MSSANHPTPFLAERLEPRTLFSGGLASATAVSFAYDATGALHVAYYDPAAKDLKYAIRSAAGTWGATVTVDAHRQAGVQLSLALDANDHPAIAYYDAANHTLKFAQPARRGWSTTTVDSKGDPGRNPSLAFDKSGYAMISYYAATKQDLRLALLARGKWRISTIDSTGAVGRYSTIAINPTDGSYGIAYEAAGGQQVRFATNHGGALSTALIDTVTNSAAATVLPSLAFDASGNADVSYVDPASSDLVLSHPSGGGWSRIVTGATAASASTSVHIDSRTGSPEVSYFATTGQVSIAAPVVAGWTSAVAGAALSTAAAIDPLTNRLGLAVNGSVAEFDPMLAAPINFTASPSFDFYPGIDLEWTDNSSLETAYRVERSTDGVHFSMIDLLPADSTSDLDMLATTPEQIYTYRIVPLDAHGDGFASAAQSITTQIPAPTDLTATVVSPGEVDLAWTNVSPHVPRLQIYCITGTTDLMVDQNVPATVTSYQVTHFADGTPLMPGTDYTFYVQQGSLAGGQAANPAYVTTGFSSPYILQPSAATPSQITMTWGDVYGESGYELQWGDDWSNFTTLAITGPDVTHYTLTNLPEATLKFFRVRALNPSGDSDFLWYSPGQTTLNAPTNLTATAMPGGQIQLNWADHSSVEAAYYVQVGGGTGLFDPTIILPANATSCTISQFAGSPLQPGRPYHFSVTAINGNFGSDPATLDSIIAVA